MRTLKPQSNAECPIGTVMSDTIITSQPFHGLPSSSPDSHLESLSSNQTDAVVDGCKSSVGTNNSEPSARVTSGLLTPNQRSYSRCSSSSLPRSSSPGLHEATAEMTLGESVVSIVPPRNLHETPRSSGDSHVLSTSSTETLLSEYPISDPNCPSRIVRRGPHVSFLKSAETGTMTELLMMGYGQIAGYFVLDGSLVKQQPFEQVRRRWVVGGHGVRVPPTRDKSKHQNGLFNTLRWGSLGESIADIFGVNDLSSNNDIKDSARLHSIPILSSPQSVLFVDLRLEPGQSITYAYRCPLPRTIPPTHKGRAMKVYYHLTIGIQRATDAPLKQPISTIEVPFRVVTGMIGEGPS